MDMELCLAQDRHKRRALVSAVMNLQNSIKRREFLDKLRDF
jgi:hypothetical protein